MTICTTCGATLDLEENEAPRNDIDGHIICDACFEDTYQHLCPICEEYFDEVFNEISPKYVIFTKHAEVSYKITAGIYEIISLPFYADGMIESQILYDAIKRLGNLPDDLDEDNLHYLMYFICDDCAKKTLKLE